jgi:small subunit ribosomal protein S3Ae
MAKARSRTAARKLRDKWKSKTWYNILAPASFDNVTVSDTLADSPDNLINRVTEVSLQDLTNDFRKSHIKLFFKINKIEETNAHTQFVGHTLTSDYLRRLIRRRRSKIDGVYDVSTRDGATLRVKPFATTDKRIQNSQRKVVREVMKKTFTDQGKVSTLSELVNDIIDGKLGREIYKNCKQLYPVKRIEIYRTEVIQQPTIMVEDKKQKPKKEEKPEEAKEPEKKPKKKKEEEKKTEEIKEPEVKEEEKPDDKKPGEETKEKPKEEKPKAKKATPKKTTEKKPAAKKKTTTKKTTAKKPATKTKKPAAKKKTTKKAK